MIITPLILYTTTATYQVSLITLRLSFYNWFAQIKIQTRYIGMYFFILHSFNLLKKSQGQWLERLSMTSTTNHRMVEKEKVLLWRLLKTPRVSVYSTLLNSLEPWMAAVTIKSRSDTIKERPFTTRVWIQIGEHLLWSHNIQVVAIV